MSASARVGGWAARPTTRLLLAAPLALTGVVLGLASGRSEFSAIAAGPLLAVLFAVLRPLPRPPVVTASGATDRAVEHDCVTVTFRLDDADPTAHVRLVVEVPEGLVADRPTDVTFRPGARQVVVPFDIRAHRWGTYEVRAVRVVVASAAFEVAQPLACAVPLTVLPEPARLASMVTPRRTQPPPGRHRAAARGPGVEFADLRRFASGDRPRDINWRASARRREIWVNERHPDRSADVVLLLDSVRDVGRVTTATLDAAVRAAAGVAEVVLRSRDRVGYVGVGGSVRWLLPGGGLRQWYRLAETLVGERPAAGHPGLGVRLLPREVLPPGTLVVALTPLLDDRVVDVIGRLALRGLDLLVVEVDPAEVVTTPDEPSWRLARRLWTLERGALRRGLAANGVTVVRWSPQDSVAEAVEEAVRLRRRASGTARVGH